MLILPIVNRNRILNVEIKLKDAEKIRTSVKFDDASESDIIVNSEKFSQSSYGNSKDVNAPIDFVRSKSLLYPRNFLVLTREAANSTLYDVYEVSQPPKKVSDGLDRLYSSVITDMRKEIPKYRKSRYISLEKLGVDDHITDEKISKLQKIVTEVKDEEQWPKLFKEAGVLDLKETVDFLNNFDCTVVSNTTIPEDNLNDILKSLEILNTRDSRNLRNYYDMALKNKEIYSRISYINQMIYGKPISLIRSQSQKQKQLIKVKESESDGVKVV